MRLSLGWNFAFLSAPAFPKLGLPLSERPHPTKSWNRAFLSASYTVPTPAARTPPYGASLELRNTVEILPDTCQTDAQAQGDA